MIEELSKLGYIEHKNLEMSYYSLAHYEGRAFHIWKTHKDQGYKIIFVNGTIATRAFKQLVFNKPFVNVVFGNITDPVGEGVIDDFTSPPKANFTGVSYPVKVDDRFRFIRKIMPTAKIFAIIYADMPQAHSYKRWVENMLNLQEFKDINVIFRKVKFVKSEGGHKRMASFAKEHILELNGIVDAFISSNDMMGGQKPFAEIVYKHATKPLIGLGRSDVMDSWGATASIYPSLVWGGKKAASMIKRLFEGESIKNIIPAWPATGIAIDLVKAKKFGLTIPHEIIEEAGDSIVDTSKN
ncbi:hypothetical protein H0A36_15320 [Endozoicomonas sp. SM1973]|uniref:ABC transporter substrate-binding protein n=1 Tax=Spartinivicinus marinus TaxID=2994442 RepID=A0A853IIE5_9GAMM|nr:ABC transporter substrate binding protein [Spartinivicinus marinus]MCX4026200.1 hypothetical protein [Spartinivicinus marinus]NYZ67386.1 hypothetical protein [Spartinivicinus marinus]